MSKIRVAERKPLSFSTTMRNPERIAGFLKCLLPYENKLLTSSLIAKIVEDIIKTKLYCPIYVKKHNLLKTIYLDENKNFTDAQIKEIIQNSPQNHKEKGFAKGWDSRFDTWYKLAMEFGFVYYEMNNKLQISNTGHMLIDAYNTLPIDELKIQNIMLNSLMKYQSNNPFRKNLNANAPLPLLLNVLQLLKQDKAENGAGLSRQELSIIICWNNNNVKELYNYIKKLRKEVGFNYADEFIYEKCLELLGSKNKNRFKMQQICSEAVDEYIRKMRITGIISLRGNGRFIDLNMLEEEKIKYIIKNYTNYNKYNNKFDYYLYMGNIDNKILEIKQSEKINLQELRKKVLYDYAKKYPENQIFQELKLVCNKKESQDELFRYINAPTRLEFLTSIALVQQFKGLDVNPNYSIDDEGLPTFTAGGGIADIECYEQEYNSYFEVSLICGRQQTNNEILPIRRHLLDALKVNPLSFSVFVAPVIHEDSVQMAEWYKYKENLDILTFNITEFIKEIKEKNLVKELLLIRSEE